MHTGEVLADDPVVHTHRLFAVTAELTLSTVLARGECDPVARLEPRDALAHRLDDARTVAAGDVREIEIDARQSAPGPDIEMVQRPRLDVEQHLVVARVRIGILAVLDDAPVAVVGELNGLHG